MTPNADFYRIDTRILVPQVDPDGWSLRITGMVDREVELSFDELLAMDRITEYVTLSCVSNEVGGDLVGNALWSGVPLADLLDRRRAARRTRPRSSGRSVDGWTAGFPTEVVADGRPCMVAVAMNGEPLPVKHGFPARLIIPGLYGYVSATKWLTEIELTTWEAFDGYWIPRGLGQGGPDQDPVPHRRPPRRRHRRRRTHRRSPGSRGRRPGPIERVEVRVDDGPWEPARLSGALSANTWVQWRYTWDATAGHPPPRGAGHRRRRRHPDRRGRAAGTVGRHRPPHHHRRGRDEPDRGQRRRPPERRTGTLDAVGQPAVGPAPVPRGHVLVVDDEPMVREVITSYLERDGYRVASVADGAAALRWLDAGEPDLVVLDLMLPTVDGLSVLAHLRKTRPTCR